jgi:cytochrome c oxidase cbb3-type subunit 4
MVNMYAFLAWVAQSFGLLTFMTAFLAICAYALWPRNAQKFANAAATPLTEED